MSNTDNSKAVGRVTGVLLIGAGVLVTVFALQSFRKGQDALRWNNSTHHTNYVLEETTTEGTSTITSNATTAYAAADAIGPRNAGEV